MKVLPPPHISGYIDYPPHNMLLQPPQIHQHPVTDVHKKPDSPPLIAIRFPTTPSEAPPPYPAPPYCNIFPKPPTLIKQRPGIQQANQTLSYESIKFSSSKNEEIAKYNTKIGIPSLESQNTIPWFPRKEFLPVPHFILKKIPESYENMINNKRDRNTSGNKNIKCRPRKRHPILHCNICGDIASHHCYYGAQACSSCRAFFRRAVQTEYNQAYFCMMERMCEITKKSRKKCKFCRYQACLSAGMRPSWVVLTEDEGMKLLKTRNKKKKLAKPALDASKSPDRSSHVKSRMFCSKEEILEINEYVKTSEYFAVSKVKDMSHSLLRELIRLIAFHESLSTFGMREIKNVLERRSVMFARKLNDFNDLNWQDQENLLKRNIPMLLEMQISTFFQPDLVWRKQLTPLIGPEEVDKMDCKLKEMHMKGLDSLQVFYTSMFPSPPLKLEAEFADLLRDIGAWPQTADEYVLLSLILLFCPDMLDLVNRRQVEDTQLKYLVLLQKYLDRRHQAAPATAVSRLGAAVDCMLRCKQLHVIFSHQ